MFITLIFAFINYYSDVAYYSDLAGIAYCNETSLQTYNCIHCSTDFTFVTRIQKNSIVAVLVKNKTHLVISFQGSVVLKDWLLDVNVYLVPLAFPNFMPRIRNDIKSVPKVHNGWFNAYKSVRTLILPIILSQKLDVLVLGHSMGGSLANLLSLELNLRLNLAVKLLTIESPRVGNYEFTEIMKNSNIIYKRITHENDLVPFLPGLALGYRQYDGEIWITSENITFCDGIEDPLCIASTRPNNNMEKHAYIRNILVGGC
eukprot:NODE_21_length_42443_cov_0.822808.p19 type:complete len:259 gc:universal NODE_21_length_42443_cov_0.822808:17990-17214(-)